VTTASRRRTLTSVATRSQHIAVTEPDGTTAPDEATLLGFLQAIASQDDAEVGRLLASSPALATATVRGGATRADPYDYWFQEIRHYVYAGDTGLHVAAAACRPAAAKSLLAKGADVGARNRRGAEPLHYAADGRGSDPGAPRAIIEQLISAGADPNARDKSGVAPLHRAVRRRSTSAVAALLDNGADPRLGNKRGSTPLHLAVQNTGASNSGSAEAKEQQREIIALLLQRGARATDTDARGKTVAAAATSDWIRELLLA
jgi:ankyrin repeat protein